jgi:CcmD family protein
MNTSDMNTTFIIAAYSITWLVLLGYLTRLIRKSSRARAAYDAMAQKGGSGARP